LRGRSCLSIRNGHVRIWGFQVQKAKCLSIKRSLTLLYEHFSIHPGLRVLLITELSEEISSHMQDMDIPA
jgi:hypothetical protein